MTKSPTFASDRVCCYPPRYVVISFFAVKEFPQVESRRILEVGSFRGLIAPVWFYLPPFGVTVGWYYLQVVQSTSVGMSSGLRSVDDRFSSQTIRGQR